MIGRRRLLGTAVAIPFFALGAAQGAERIRLVFIHGRSQQGLDPVQLKRTWLDTLVGQLAIDHLKLPGDVDVEFPYYGDELEKFVTQSKLPLASDIHARGDSGQDEFLVFQAQIANELAENSGVTDADIDAEYGSNPRQRGPLNWEWVQAIIRAIDKHAGGVSASAIENFTRDVYLYLSSMRVRDTIDGIVEKSFNGHPTVVVGHSLGSVVAYNILRKRQLNVPLLVTIGSPLGIRAVRTPLTPIGFPEGVSHWFNAYDPRDVVALNPLDAANFAVQPPVENYSGVKNSTDNRHGITGYLNDPEVAKRIYSALA
ncbi:hypothetical protein [Rhizobium miluonense]|uniref:Alpha/beta hydrolase n=1 Tax=Rhizobium miluonense TaxID=411945 RepID=A0ABU1SY09_9HYPH|nr:hypothetical protein [Rhizobium miluonense]MDR6903862.1 hypothetical protein [Rhizobium miluonense]